MIKVTVQHGHEKNGISINGQTQYPYGKKLILTLTLPHTQKPI